MSQKQKNPYADTEYLRAFHTERREAEAAYDVAITTTITTATRPDRVQIRQEAMLVNPRDPSGKPLCSYTTEWPNVNARSFSAELFNSSVMMTRLVQDSVADLWHATLRAQKRG